MRRRAIMVPVRNHHRRRFLEHLARFGDGHLFPSRFLDQKDGGLLGLQRPTLGIEIDRPGSFCPQHVELGWPSPILPAVVSGNSKRAADNVERICYHFVKCACDEAPENGSHGRRR